MKDKLYYLPLIILIVLALGAPSVWYVWKLQKRVANLENTTSQVVNFLNQAIATSQTQTNSQVAK